MYRMNEGSIDLPREWQDRTINVVSSGGGAAPGLSLTITRDDVPYGMSFDEYVADQLGQAGKSLKDFSVVGQRGLSVNGAEAVEVDCTWVSRQGPIHQIITTVRNGRRALVLTASVGGRMTDGQRAEMQRIVGTLRLDGTV